jgi:hypothetical protein
MRAVESGRWRKAREVAGGVFLLLSAAWIMTRLGLQDASDDGIFLHALDQQGMVEFLVSRYHDWSGRTLIDWLLVGTIGIPMVWTLGIPLALLGSAWCIWRLTLAERLPMLSGTALVLLMAFLIHVMVLAEAVYWVTGFYNYLLPCFLALVAMVVVMTRDTAYAALYVVALPAVVFACQSEQVAVAVLVTLSARIALLRLQGQGVGRESLLLAAGAAAALVSWLAPGNVVRLAGELRWFPEYADAGLLEKIGMGLDRLNVHARSPRNLLLLFVAALSAWATLRSCRSAAARIAVAILLLFVASVPAIVLIRLAGLEGLPGITGVGAHLSPAEWAHGGIFVSMAFTICVYGALATGAACRARDLPGQLVGAGIPLLAAASTMLVSLSPTIYASGFRILFVGDVWLLVHGAMLLSSLLEPRWEPRRTATPQAGATA